MTAAGMISLILAAAGLIVMITSLIGLIRFPDFFTRLHIQGVGDTLGALLIILGMMAATGAHLITVKIFLIFLVIMLTNPIGTNLMMIAAIFNKDYQAYTRVRPGNEPEVVDISKTKADEKDKSDISGKEQTDTDKSDAEKKSGSGAKRRSGRSGPSMKQTRAELIEIAEGMGISVPDHATKKGILELIYQEKPELRPEKSGSKQSGSGKAGTKKSGSKQSGSGKSGSDKAASKQSSAKKDNGTNSSKSGSNRSANKNNSKNKDNANKNKSSGKSNSKAGASKAAAKTDGRKKTGKNNKRGEGKGKSPNSKRTEKSGTSGSSKKDSNTGNTN